MQPHDIPNLRARLEAAVGGHVPKDLTVAQMVNRFMAFAQDYYPQPERKGKGEIGNYRYALKPLLMLYGETRAVDVTTLELKAVRQYMLESDLSRNTINQRIKKIRRVFRWAVEERLIPPTVCDALSCLTSLKRGRSTARETPPVQGVSLETVERCLPYMSAPIRAMVQLQLLTGMRPGEVCRMQGRDIATTAVNMIASATTATDATIVASVYRPTSHKTQHHGHTRVIPLGPKAQLVLQPFLNRAPAMYLFSPRDVRPDKKNLSDRYNPNSYLTAVRRACKKANVPNWSPNQLRHTAAQIVRDKYGLEAASALLGHSRVETSQIYASRSDVLAREVAAKVG